MRLKGGVLSVYKDTMQPCTKSCAGHTRVPHREVNQDFALRSGYMPGRPNPRRIVNGDYRGAFLESRKCLQRQ